MPPRVRPGRTPPVPPLARLRGALIHVIARRDELPGIIVYFRLRLSPRWGVIEIGNKNPLFIVAEGPSYRAIVTELRAVGHLPIGVALHPEALFPPLAVGLVARCIARRPLRLTLRYLFPLRLDRLG